MLRRLFYDLRTEGAGAARETVAVALGVFIGCLPIYGLHLLICWIAGFLLGLNRVKMYLAANISNPLVAPWLIFAEVQAGAWLRRGSFHALTRESIEAAGIAVFGVDAMVGSVAVGALLACLAATGTYSLVRTSAADRPFADLARRASDRYLGASITAWEFARGKLRMDPVYRAALSPEVLTSGGSLVDIGCGQGLMLALLAEARHAYDAGTWPTDWPPPPRFTRMTGIEIRRRVAAIAREALAGDADVIDANARMMSLEPASAVLLFDVLQLLRPGDQEALLARMAACLEPGGVVLVREADASAGWRFTAVRVGNRLKAFAVGTWRRQTFHPRTEAEWRDCFARLGFRAAVWPMGEGTPFANILFRLTRESR
jgi:uncharacterized protein (DUF2062 family)/ubiquinone/menaquinone biosynthesis C-methylase UbiE